MCVNCMYSVQLCTTDVIWCGVINGSVMNWAGCGGGEWAWPNLGRYSGIV